MRQLSFLKASARRQGGRSFSFSGLETTVAGRPVGVTPDEERYRAWAMPDDQSGPFRIDQHTTPEPDRIDQRRPRPGQSRPAAGKNGGGSRFLPPPASRHPPRRTSPHESTNRFGEHSLTSQYADLV